MKGKCNICNYSGSFDLFSIKNEFHLHNVWSCPKCKSKEQDRLIWEVFEKFKDTFNHKSILYCSPMKCLQDKLKNEDTYITIDLRPQENDKGTTMAMLKQDLQNLCFKDKYFDFIICSHILDKVEDDMKALREMYRVLKKRGTAFIIVPVLDRRTRELKEVINDKRRLCGTTYFSRYKKAGFEVKFYANNTSEYLSQGELLAVCKKR